MTGTGKAGALLAAFAVLTGGCLHQDEAAAPAPAEPAAIAVETPGVDDAPSASSGASHEAATTPPGQAAVAAAGQAAPDVPQAATPQSGPDKQRLDDLENRISGIEAQLLAVSSDLRSTLSSLQEGLRPDRATQAVLEAFMANQRALSIRLEDVARHRKPSRAGKPSRPRPGRKPPEAPFRVTALDVWNGRPYAVLDLNGQTVLAHEGSVLSGWRVQAIRWPGRITVRHERTGTRRELQNTAIPAGARQP